MKNPDFARMTVVLYAPTTNLADQVVRALADDDRTLSHMPDHDAVLSAIDRNTALVILEYAGDDDLIRQVNTQRFSTTRLITLTRDDAASLACLEAGADDALRLPVPEHLLRRKLLLHIQDAYRNVTYLRYTSMLNRDQDAIYIIDNEDLRIQDWNDSAERLYGYSLDEALGQRSFELLKTQIGGKSISEDRSNLPVPPWHGEIAQFGKAQERLNIISSVSPVTDEKGKLLEYLILNRDISIERRIEETLRDYQTQLTSIINAISDLVMVLDNTGRYIHIVTPSSTLLLQSASDILGHYIHEYFPLEIANMLVQVIQDVLTIGENRIVAYEAELRGERRWFEATITPLITDQTLWVVRDITAQRLAERALQDAARHYEMLFQNANDAILLIDLETGNILQANEQASALLGFTLEEFNQLSINELEVTLDNDTSDTLQINIQNSNQLILEQFYRHKDGTLIPIETSSRVMEYRGRIAVLCFARDVTRRRQAQKAEREQRLLAEALADSAASFNSTLDLNHILDQMLTHVSRLVKSTSASILFLDGDVARVIRNVGFAERGMDMEVISKVSLPLSQTLGLQRVFETQKPYVIQDVRAPEVDWIPLPKDEWIRAVLLAPIILKGEVIGFITLDSDEVGFFTSPDAERLQAFANQAAIAIQNARLYEEAQNYASELERRVQERTAALSEANEALKQQIIERREIEEALEDERNLLRTIMDNIPDPIYVKDTEGRFILANVVSYRDFGLKTLDEIRGKTDFDLMSHERSVFNREREMNIIRTGQPVVNLEMSIFRGERPEGIMLVSQMPLRDARGEIIGIVGVNRDITDLKIAEAQLDAERNLLRSLIDTIPDLIFAKDLQGRYLLTNSANLRSMQMESPVDLIGKTQRDLFPGPETEAEMEHESYLMASGTPLINQPHEVASPDGTKSWSLLTKIPLRNSEGEVTGLIGVSRDITEVKQAEEQLEQVMNSARCLLWFAIVEQKDDETFWNLHVANEEAAERLLPVRRQHADYTHDWLDSIMREDLERRQFVFKTHLRFNKLNYNLELRCRQSDGKVRWLMEEVQIRPLTANRYSLVGVCTDITERKLAEEALQQANDELERRVNLRTQALMQANENLKQEISERQRAEEAERQQRILAETLRRSGDVLIETLDQERVFEHVLTELRNVVPHDAANIMLIEGDMTQVVRQNGYPVPLGTEPFPLAYYPEAQQQLEHGGIIIINDTHTYPDWRTAEKNLWIRSHISVPIRLEDRVIGLLKLDASAPNQFDGKHAEWLQTFANQASLAIRNARLVQQIRDTNQELEQRVRQRTAELNHERAQLRAILDAMRDGVIYQDQDSRPQYTNRALTDITGYTAEMWLDRSAFERVNFEPADTWAEQWRRIERSLEAQGYWEGETQLRRRDESLFDAGLMRTLVRNTEGQRIGIVTVVRDISQAKQLEEQKKRFIASASHELRTPIANMKTRLYLMRRQPDKFDAHIGIAEDVVNWMQYLIEDMFDLSRFERGVIMLEREEVVLQKFLQQVVRFQELEAERQQITLECILPQEPVRMAIDPFRLTQVITNLLGNALQYTPENGRIILRLDVENNDKMGEHAVIRVIDNGQGIDPNHLPHLFQPFYRGAQNDNKGAGLGLSIAREIVGLHGGDISVESALNEGSQFIVRLPFEGPAIKTEDVGDEAGE